MMTAPTVDSFDFLQNGETIQSGKNREIGGRTWQSRGNTPPDAAILRAGEDAVLRFEFAPDQFPTNFFLDRANIFLAIHDGELAESEKADNRVKWTITVLP